MTTYSTQWKDKNNVVRDLHDKRMPDGLGTSGQVPRMNQAGTAMEWATIATGGDVVDVKVDGTSVLDANKIAQIDLGDFGITATSGEINVLDGITATTTELNYTDGVTSNIQTQLNNKQPTINSSNKLSADLVQDGTTNKVVTQTEKTTWNNKSVVSVAATGSTTDDIKYITVNGTEKRIKDQVIISGSTPSGADTTQLWLDTSVSPSENWETIIGLATSSQAGLVKPVAKTSAMTATVGIDSSTGQLYTAPGGGLIDDSATSLSTTWSSSKINTLVGNVEETLRTIRGVV